MGFPILVLQKNLVLEEKIELQHFDSVDTGAEAVFEYLQEGTP